jgi:hypothetical protein
MVAAPPRRAINSRPSYSSPFLGRGIVAIHTRNLEGSVMSGFLIGRFECHVHFTPNSERKSGLTPLKQQRLAREPPATEAWCPDLARVL